MRFSGRNKIFNTLFFIFSYVAVNAQTTIRGIVTNSNKDPQSGASIRVKESNQGTYADSAGSFLLIVQGKGKRNLELSSVGYTTREIEISLNDTIIFLDIELATETKTLGDVVVISVGSFEASDKAKGASLTPIDAVTVAGNGGDIANALRTLPGAQQIGEQDGLFVRGGSNDEAKQFVDGSLLPSPNYASIPGLPQPARLNPFLFKGILFSTGGYSALYGEAMSSALILETVDMPDKSSAALHIFPQNLGAGFQELSMDGKRSYGINAGYGNMQFYNRIVPQIPDYFKGPEYISTDANFRIKTSATGMLKFYCNYGYSNIGIRSPDIDSSSLFSSFEQVNTNFYSNLSYRESLGNNWKIEASTAFDNYQNGITRKLFNVKNQQLFLPDYPYSQYNLDSSTNSKFAEARFVLRKQLVHNQAIRFGAEYFYNHYLLSSHYPSDDATNMLYNNLIAAFAETDIYIAKKMAAKIGVRAEYSALLKRTNLAPRLSLAYRFADGGQINMAYGIFYQLPEMGYLAQNRDLDFSSADHYIINYQKKAGNRLFRIEAYYKVYHDLVTTYPSYANWGDGYARGIELFWRDKRTFKNVDYWITYTYLDTKRKYLDFPYAIAPSYSTPHTLSLVVKKYFQDINLSANMAYTLATGRPYYDIQNSVSGSPFFYDEGTTPVYHVMNLSFAYLFSIFPKWKNKEFSGIGLGCNNVFGSKEVFGYYFSYNGTNKMAVTPPATRTFYIGLFMSFGIDRRNDFINENL
ncbi:MAG TPA: TonB-dependent receptor [Puia sp.]|jgi:vitamin B12 transporter|nr:TonB-dependent receptor [Puia sp.]